MDRSVCGKREARFLRAGFSGYVFGVCGFLFALLHFCLQCSQCIQVTQSSACSLVLDYGSLFLLTLGSVLACSLLGLACFGALYVFEDTAVRKDNALALLVEFDYLELELLVQLSLASVFLNQVLGSSKAFYAVLQLDNGTLVQQLGDGSFVDRILSEDGFKYIPGILFQLLVAQRQATVVLVNL